MSHPRPSHRLRRRRARSAAHVALRRRLLLGAGAVAAVGAAGWSAVAATTDAPTRPVAAPAAVATAEDTTAVTQITAALDGWLKLAAELDDPAPLTRNLPFGVQDFVAKELPSVAQLFTWADETIASAAGEGLTLAAFDERLDDLDGDGDPASDYHGIDGVVVDFDADITPQTGTGPYDVKVSVDVDLAADSPLAMALDGIQINGVDASDALELKLGSTLKVDPLGAKKVSIPVTAEAVGTVRAGVDMAFDGADNPLAFQTGILGVRGTGTVKADAGVSVTLKDPNGDGVIDETELATPGKLLKLGCVSEGAKVDLAVTTDLAGLSGKVGTITLNDTSLCNGLSAPEVKLGDLAQFRTVTLGDVVNGLAQVTRAVQSAQAAGDLDIPFVEQPLRDMVDASDKLVQFFVDNGFTDKDNPLATISVDNAAEVGVKTVQDLMPKLAEALGMEQDALDFRYDDGRLLLGVKASGDEGDKTADLELGETLTGVGITEVTGAASATIRPSYAIDFGIGMDLTEGKSFDERFFLTNGAGGAIATLDAPVKADIQVDAIASVLGVHLADSVADGPVELLRRADSTKPMVSVGLIDPNADGRTTLAELAAAKALPVTGTINAAVPSFDLTASAELAGVPLGAGKVNVAWTKVPDASTLKVTPSQDFLDNVLPFTLDTGNPRAMITQVLTVTKQTIDQMRAAVAAGNATSSKPLPLIGKSVADLDPVLQKVQGVVDELIQVNDIKTMAQLQTELSKRLGTALGIKLPTGLTATEGTTESGPSLAASDLVNFRYLKRDGTTPAALIVDLDFGACTKDRTEGHTCTVSTDALTGIPFNLDLGSGSKAGGIAGVGTSGTVSVSFDAHAKLSFGVELPDVAMGQAGQLPKVTGQPKLFVIDDALVDIGVGASVDGTINAALGPLQVSLGKQDVENAQARIAARFKVATPAPTGKRLIIGSEPFKAWTLTLVPSSPLTVHEPNDKLAAKCPPLIPDGVDACAVLPVYVGDTDLGSITFKAPDLLKPSGWDVDSTSVENAMKNEAIQWKLLVEGVRTLTHQVSDGLRNLPAGTKIPLLGADVTAGADVMDKFDTNVLGRVDDLATTLTTQAPTTGLAKSKAEELLAEIPGVSESTAPSVEITCVLADGSIGECKGDEPIAKLQSLEVHLPLFYGVADSTAPFDLGFPGLRLASEAGVSGSAGIRANLAFGVDRELGFYVPTAGADKELSVEATGDLPEVADGPDLKGDLAFIPIEIEDNHDTNAEGDPVHDVSVTAAVDLRTDRADGRLPLAELGRARVVPSIDASAKIDLGIKTLKGEKAASALPTFTTDLRINAGVAWTGTGAPIPSASIRFDNVKVDAGSLVTDFLKPAAKTLHTYTGPLEKPIDAIRQPIPGATEAAKLAGMPKPPTWYDAFKAADQAANGPNSTGLQMIDRVIQLVDMVRVLDSADAPDGVIDLGSFTVAEEKVKDPVALTEADKLIEDKTVLTSNVLGAIDFKGPQGAEADAALANASAKGGFKFPAFENPSSLFGMLLGKDVTLVYFDAGTLSVQRGFQFRYPIGPANLYIGGSAGVSGHLAAGFDTYGLRKGFEVLLDDDTTNNTAWRVSEGLLQGLYLDDFDQAGNDVPEIRFDAELTAGASVGVPGFEAGAEGGVHGTAEFNLKADDTGKVRYTHLAAQLKVNRNPLCFFDASAYIDAFVRAYVDTPVGRGEYPIVSKRIYEQEDLFAFCQTPQGGEDGEEPYVNVLADVDAEGKMTFRNDPSPESFQVTQTDHETVEVSSQGLIETYTGVKSIFADLRGGDDVFDVRSSALLTAEAPRMPVTVCGGAGNDRITVDAGTATLYGDGGPGCVSVISSAAGSDSLAAGATDDVLRGGPGADDVDGGAGVDELYGEQDDDVLRGGTGNDKIDGGNGTDYTSYTDREVPVTVDLEATSGAEGEADTSTSIEAVYGGAGADVIKLPASGEVLADGGAGDDELRAGAGTALLMGSAGSDTFIGGTGVAQVVGSDGNDVLIDGPGSQTFLGLGGTDTVDYSALAEPVRVSVDGVPGDGPMSAAVDNIVDTDILIGTAEGDELVGGSAGEELCGGAGDDRLEGGPGSDVLLGAGGLDELVGDSGADQLRGGADEDVLQGGAGMDALLGEAGQDDLSGGDGDDALDGGVGDDRLDGGLGADAFTGGDGFDWADYSDRTDDLTIHKDNAANDGAGEKDNVRTDVERITTGTGADVIWGWTGDDVLETGAGNDRMHGQDGADTFEGGEGDDDLYDLDMNKQDASLYVDHGNDRFVAGPGNDEVYSNGGADVLELGAGRDSAYGGNDADRIEGGDGDDSIYGRGGDDYIDGGVGTDGIQGGDGDDEIHGGTGAGTGTIYGGLGEDTIYNATGGGSVYTGTGGGAGTDADPDDNTVYGYAGV